MNFDDLTPEQQEKVRACKSPEELFELAKAEGRQLTEDELAEIAGGEEWYNQGCNGIKHLGPFTLALTTADGDKLYTCKTCGKQEYESKLLAAGVHIW